MLILILCVLAIGLFVAGYFIGKSDGRVEVLEENEKELRYHNEDLYK